MKRTKLLLFCCFWIYKTTAQQPTLNLQYGVCNNCNGNNPTYNNQNFNVSEILSDYGMRITTGTAFHQGIDYVPNDFSIGNVAITPVSGTIVLVQGGNGLKKVCISGENNGLIFSYLHIFISSVPSYPYVMGKFVLVRFTHSQTIHYGVIDLINGIAYSDVNNVKITYPSLDGTDYYTTNHINAGSPVAPIGNSGTMDYHLHFSHLESGIADRSATESIDPWNVIRSGDNILETRIRTRKQSNGTTPATNFSGNACEHNIGTDEWNTINLSYSDNTRNVIEVEVSLPGATTVAGSGGDQYSNVVMNEDMIQALIKKESTPQAGYARILGSQNYGYIKIDPEGEEEIYPIRIYRNYGGIGLNDAGIIPFAYRSSGDNVAGTGSYICPLAGNPYDYYLFPDFHHRIHKQHVPGNALRLGDTPSSVFYNDDNYTMRSRVSNIHNDLRQESAECNFTLDNFQPFITHFAIKDGNKVRHSHDRIQSDPTGNNNGTVKISQKETKNDGTYGTLFTMVVNTSEPLEALTLQWRDYNLPPLSSGSFTTAVNMTSDATKTIWTAGMVITTYGEKEFKFVGQDLSGNKIMDIYNMTEQHSNSKKLINIPTRRAANIANSTSNQISSTVWANLPTPISAANVGQDYVRLSISCGIKAKGFTQELASGNRNATPPNCDDLDDISESIIYNQGNCSVTIGLEGVLPPYHVGWKNEVGEYILGSITKEVYASGYYCYIVESNDGCCSREGCIEVKNMLNIAEPELITDCDGTHIDFKLDPLEYSIQWYEWNGTTFSFLPEFNNDFSIDGLLHFTTYKYIVSQNGCQAEGTVKTDIAIQKIKINEPQVSNASCENPTGQIIFVANNVASGGAGNFTYEWSNGESTSDIYNLPIGEYSLTVTDGNGCSATKTISVFPSMPQYPNSITKSCKNGTTGRIEMYADPINEENPIFEWTVPFTQEGNSCIVENLAVGQYCVIISYPSNHCSFEKCYDILPLDPQDLVATDVIKQPCAGQSNGSITINVTGGSGLYTYAWSTGYTSSFNSIKNIGAGTYTVTITDRCDNQLVKTYIVTAIGSEIIANHTTEPYNENEQLIRLSVNGNYNYTWYKYSPILGNYGVVGKSKDIHGHLFPGKYYVQIRDNNGCFINHEVFECETVNPNIDFRLNMVNLLDCSEGISMEASIDNVVGEEPFIYFFNGNKQNVDKVILPSDRKGYSFYARVANRCGISSQIRRKTIPCDKICPDNCLHYEITGSPTCFDACYDYEAIGSFFTKCTKIKLINDCNDNVFREALWLFNDQFLGATHLTAPNPLVAKPLNNAAGANLQFTNVNTKTNCESLINLKLPNQCIDKWFLDFIDETFGGCQGCPESFNYVTSCDENNWNCDDDCKFCKYSSTDLNNGEGEFCKIAVYCNNDSEHLKVKSYTELQGDTCEKYKPCPEWVIQRLINVRIKKSDFSCDDKIIDLSETNENGTNLYFINSSIINDTLHGELLTKKQNLFKTLKYAIPFNEKIIGVIDNAYFNKTIVSKNSDDILLRQIKGLNEVNRTESIMNTDLISVLDVQLNSILLLVRKDNRFQKLKIKNDLSYEILNFNYPVGQINAEKNNSFVTVNGTLVEIFNNGIKTGAVNLNQLSKISSVNIMKDGNIVVGGEFIDSIIIGTEKFLSKGIQDIIFILINSNGQILKSNQIDKIGKDINSTKANRNGVINFTYMEEVASSEFERYYCPNVGNIQLCPPPVCCDSFGGKLLLDTMDCTLKWSTYPNKLYTSFLQVLSDTGFVTLTTAVSPFPVEDLQAKTFRLFASSNTCPPLYSNIVVAQCDTTSLCPADSLSYVLGTDSIDIYINLIENKEFDLRIDYVGYNSSSSSPVIDSLFIPLSGNAGANNYTFDDEITYLMPTNPNTNVVHSILSLRCPECIEYCIVDSVSILYRSRNELSIEHNESQVKIYPNPFSYGFTIDLYSSTDNFTTLIVTDLAGRMVYYDLLPIAKNNNRYYLKESEKWPNGFYQIALKSNDGSIQSYHKIIKSE